MLVSYFRKILGSNLIQNILALGFVQIINYILPLLLIPYLLHTLGVDGWGKITFVQFCLQYFIVIVTYGFQWSAVNKISPIRDNWKEVSHLFNAYWQAQWILVMLSFFFLLIGLIIFESFLELKELFLIGFLAVLGSVIFSSWLMQAIEELKMMAFLQLIAQLSCFICIFLFVKDTNDAYYALFFQSINNLIAGVLCIFFLIKKGLRFYLVSWKDIVIAFKDGFTLFKAQLWISLYTNSIPVVLGMVSSSTYVATYALADKLQKGIRFILNPISRAVFPRLALLYAKDINLADKLFKNSLLLTLFISALGSSGLFLFSENIVRLFNATHLPLAIDIVEILSVMPILVGLSSTISIQKMIPQGKEKILQRIWFSAAVISIALVYPICKYYGIMGAVFFTIFIEVYIVVAMLITFFVKRY